MAQDNYIVVSAPRAEALADINRNFEATVTLNSGNSAPSTTYAGMLWLNTTSTPYVLNINDDANTPTFFPFMDTDGNMAPLSLTSSGDIKATAGDIILSAGFLNLGARTTKTIASGVITPTTTRTVMTPQSGTTDDLDTVTAGTEGDVIILYGSSGNTITVKEAVDNILLKGAVDYSMGIWDSLTLCLRGSFWTEIARGDR